MLSKVVYIVNKETRVFVAGKYSFDLPYTFLRDFPNGEHIVNISPGSMLKTSLCAVSGILFNVTYYVENYQAGFNILTLTEGPYGPTMYNLVK